MKVESDDMVEWSCDDIGQVIRSYEVYCQKQTTVGYLYSINLYIYSLLSSNNVSN